MEEIRSNNIVQGLIDAKKIAIIGHKESDADCFGAMLALQQGLESLGKTVLIISPEKLPKSLEFFNKFSIKPFKAEYIDGCDLVVVVDCPDLSRSTVPQVLAQYRDSHKKIALIDHHIPGTLKNVDYPLIVQKCCSASEIVYYLLVQLKARIDKNIATFILTGIYNDTSNFQNTTTTEGSLKVASEMILIGAHLNTIVNQSVSGQSIEALKGWGLILSRLYLNPKYNIAITYLTAKDIKDNKLDADTLIGVSNYINVIKGARGTVFISENNEGIIKISLRTRDKDINVAKLAKHFGGGGHPKAAGFSFKGQIINAGNKVEII